jgi:hypothetical protein
VSVADGKTREELREMMRKELEMLKQLDEREREIEVWEREGSPSEEKLR